MRILTFALCLLCFSVSAQNNSIHVYPWNPDSDNDNQIGVDDLQSFLTVYGNSFGLPPEPCTYDGTLLEDFFIGINTGEVILDSVYIEFELEDITSFYVEGCPDIITDTVVFAISHLFSDPFVYQPFNNPHLVQIFLNGIPGIGGDNITIHYNFNATNGLYYLRFINSMLPNLGFTADGFFVAYNAYTVESSIPWPSSWIYDENGLEIEFLGDNWTSYANYLHILPYWHYADE